MNYKFAFFGTPRFAEIILERLIQNGFVPSALICNPDRPVGRKKVITPPPTKLLAQKHNIPISQPEKLEIRNLRLEIGKVDFALAAAYGKIIPKDIISTFPKGMIGVHPSLLPKYRGASPIQTAILNGEKETGITLFLIDEKTDHGKIIAQNTITITSNDNYNSLEEKLAEIGAELAIKTIPDYIDGKIITEEQNHTEATLTKKFETEDGFVSSEALQLAFNGEKSFELHKKICALNPEPGVWTLQNGKRIKLLESKLKDGKLILKKIQIEGKTPQILN
jgi:methionyl-tRNA formyltransferase